jgi:hypothetical protein
VASRCRRVHFQSMESESEGWDIRSESPDDPGPAIPAQLGASTGGAAVSVPRGRDRSRSPVPRAARSRSTSASPDRSVVIRSLLRSASAPPPPAAGAEYWVHPLWQASMHLRLDLPPTPPRPMTWELFCAGSAAEAEIAKASCVG